jgi:cell division protein FtsW (lipid II flippase)
VFIAVIAGFILSGNNNFSGQTATIVAALLILYCIGLSLVSAGKNQDEQSKTNRNITERAGLIAANVIISLGIIYQLFTHTLDFWLLVSLMIINLVKIISLVYLNNKKINI